MTLDHAQPAPVTRVAAPPAPTVRETSVVTRAHTPSPQSTVRLIDIGRETVAALGAHAGPVLTIGLVGFALPSTLATWIGLTLYGTLPPALCPFRALPDGPLLAALFATALFAPLASGAIARLALDGTSSGCGLRAACVAAVKRMPALALGWLVYGALMVGAILLLAPALHDAQLDPLSVRASVWPSRPVNGVVRETIVRGVTMLLPDPGLALCGVATAAWARGVAISKGGGVPTAAVVTAWNSSGGDPAALALKPAYEGRMSVSWALTLGSLVMLLVGECLLRFRVVAVMQPGGVTPYRAMVDGIGRAWRRFGVVCSQVWLLRLVVTGAHIAMVGLPVAFALQIVNPHVSLVAGLAWMRPVCMLLVPVGVAAVESLCMAFSTVYDARLFVALQNADRGRS